MKLQRPNCPECGEPARGSVETLHGVALFDEIDAEGNTEYEGATEINWDSQTTDEPLTLECKNGHQWADAAPEPGSDRCVYCGAEVDREGPVPGADDVNAWGKLALEHADGCEWIETRAHVRGPGYLVEDPKPDDAAIIANLKQQNDDRWREHHSLARALENIAWAIPAPSAQAAALMELATRLRSAR